MIKSGVANTPVTVFHKAQCFLGEGPMWHSKRKSCFWTDIEGFGFYEHQWNTDSVIFYKTIHRVSLIVQSSDGNIVLGMHGGIAKMSLDTKELFWISDLEKQYPQHRCNDGACDSKGRLWIGTMDFNFEPGEGALYCINKDRDIEKKIGSVTISNGLCWSPDNRHLYFIDSPTQKVQAFNFDEDSSNIYFEKDVIKISKKMGTPDGMAIDEEGMLWIAHWGGFGVYRWDPHTGKMIGSIVLPVPNITSCAFVGENLEYLLITTARQDLTTNELDKYPESGHIFIAKPGIKGLPSFNCSL